MKRRKWEAQRWDIPDWVTNPKTRAKYEKMKEDYDKKFLYAELGGYTIEKRKTNIWSFSRNGEKSVLGFDSAQEVLDFIYEHNPDPKTVFPRTTNQIKYKYDT